MAKWSVRLLVGSYQALLFQCCMCLNLFRNVIVCSSHKDPEQLFQACEQGDLEVVHRFLAAGIGVDIRDAVRLELVIQKLMNHYAEGVLK